MIPESDPENPPPLTARYLILLALGAAYLNFSLILILHAMQGAAALTPALLGIAAILAYGGAFALAAQRLEGAPPAALGLLPAARPAWLSVGFLLPSILLMSEIDNVTRALIPPPETIANATAPAVASLAVVLERAIVWIAVLPLVEELFFRGLLQPHFVARWGRVRGVAACAGVSGVGFGLLYPWAFPVVLARGALLGFMRESSGSVLPGMLLHVGFGLAHALAVAQWFGIPGFDDLASAHTPLEWLIPAALATGVGLGLCRALLRARELAHASIDSEADSEAES